MERLEEKYWRIFQEEGPIDLEDYLRQLKAGEHGEISAKEINDFLDDMLQTMLGNIQLKASEAPHYEAMREQVEQETVARIERLKTLYGAD